jgi:predicted nucleic acid-binding protein
VVSHFIDTAIVVDILRKYPPALAWANAQKDIGVTHIVWLEVLEGVLNKFDQQNALRILKRFELVELTVADLSWATDALVRLGLSHNVDAFDCLIASVSYRLQLPLYTINLKHFTPLLGTLAVRPY